MPITPLHLLAGVGLKAIKPKFDFTSFAVVNIVIDIDSLLGLVSQTGHEDMAIHGFAHSVLGTTLVALFVWLFVRKRQYALPSVLIGAWSHVLLDVFYHQDVLLMYPFDGNPFYGLVQPVVIDWLCVAIGVLLPACAWKDCQSAGCIRAKWFGH
jgi:membrane-bound metal-dependent hydrolase YbcI (DUF457 family)